MVPFPLVLTATLSLSLCKGSFCAMLLLAKNTWTICSSNVLIIQSSLLRLSFPFYFSSFGRWILFISRYMWTSHVLILFVDLFHSIFCPNFQLSLAPSATNKRRVSGLKKSNVRTSSWVVFHVAIQSIWRWPVTIIQKFWDIPYQWYQENLS